MTALLLTALLTAQAISFPGVPDRTGGRLPTIATIEGMAGAGAFGLFDGRTGEFTPERLDSTLDGWTQLTPFPIDFSGRVELTAGLASSPRLRDDVGANGARIDLPVNGSLYMLRGARQGELRFALVHVRSDGSPTCVLSAPALTGGASPFLPKVGIAPGASGVLVATHESAGGDLYEVNLTTDEVQLRTGAIGPLAFGTDGVWLGSTWGFGISSQGPWRFTRRPGEQVELVTTAGPAPLTWRGDAAVNPTCMGAVAIAGSGPGQWLPFVFSFEGLATPAAATPSAISGPGFAPESSFGPFLALCDDGATAAWRVESGSAPNDFRDVFLGRAAASPQESAASGDLQIVDTANEVGRVISAPTEGFLFIVGEDNDPTEGGLEGAEILRAHLSASGQMNLTNVSRTSPDTSLPLFDQGVPSWTPAFVSFVAPSVVIVHEDDEKALYAVNVDTNSAVRVLTEVREVFWLEAAGAPGRPGGWIACVERDDDQRRIQVVGASTSTALASIIDQGSPTAEFTSPAAWRGAKHVVGYTRSDLGLNYLDVIPLTTLVRNRWPHPPSHFQPPLAFLSPRRVAFSEGPASAMMRQTLWSIDGSARDLELSAPARPALILR